MPHNLIKIYADLLDIHFLGEKERVRSLRGVFDRDIVDNRRLAFRGKWIFPIKSDGEDTMGTLFKHLTCENEKVPDDNGQIYNRRVYEPRRSERLHWIRCHIEEIVTDSDIEVFSCIERDIKARKDVTKTYIYNKTRKYVIVLEMQRKSGDSYYLLTAYHLNKPEGKKAIEKKLKQKISEII